MIAPFCIFTIGLLASTSSALPVPSFNTNPSGAIALNKRFSLSDFNIDLFNVGVVHPEDVESKRSVAEEGAVDKRFSLGDFNFDLFNVGVVHPEEERRSTSSAGLVSRFFNWSGFNPGNPIPPTPSPRAVSRIERRSTSNTGLFSRFFNWSGFNPGNPIPPTVSERAVPRVEKSDTRLLFNVGDPTIPPEATAIPDVGFVNPIQVLPPP